MKKLAILIVLLLTLVASPVLAGTGDGLLEVGWEDHTSGEVVVVHFYNPLYGEEADTVRDALWETQELLPNGDSHFAVVRFPEVGRYHVRLSDGAEHVVYAVGTGSTFEAAVADLVRDLQSR